MRGTGQYGLSQSDWATVATAAAKNLALIEN
jgi:hypothetical protein